MRLDPNDAAYLWDMREAAREAMDFIQGVAYQQFVTDRRLRLAVERALEIIGEAARRVSNAFQQAHPELPWRQIIGQRNVLAHNYGDIDPGMVWAVVTQRLPELVRQLDALIPPIVDTET